jgi:ABC-type anion transport system duplicated permease subunit
MSSNILHLNSVIVKLLFTIKNRDTSQWKHIKSEYTPIKTVEKEELKIAHDYRISTVQRVSPMLTYLKCLTNSAKANIILLFECKIEFVWKGNDDTH